MRKLILTFLLLAVPAAWGLSTMYSGRSLTVPAESMMTNQVVVVKKDCYGIDRMHYVKCNLIVKNIGRTDVKNAVVSYTSPEKKLTASDIIDYLPASETVSAELVWDLYRRSDEEIAASRLADDKKFKILDELSKAEDTTEYSKAIDESVKVYSENLKRDAEKLSKKYEDLTKGLQTGVIAVSYQPAD